MIEIPKVGDNVIIYAGYNDFEGEVLEVKCDIYPVGSIKLKRDKKGKEIVEIDIEKIYAITHFKE